MSALILPQTPPNENKTVCDTLNRSYTAFHHDKYGGIPQAFFLNVVGASLLIVIFSILRRRAGDYARLALNHETWTEIFQQEQINLLPSQVLSIPHNVQKFVNGIRAGVNERGDVIKRRKPSNVENTVEATTTGVKLRNGEKIVNMNTCRDDEKFRSIDADDIEEIVATCDETSSPTIDTFDKSAKKMEENLLPKSESSQNAVNRGTETEEGNVIENNNNENTKNLNTDNNNIDYTDGTPNCDVKTTNAKSNHSPIHYEEVALINNKRPQKKEYDEPFLKSRMAHRASRLLRLESPRWQDNGFFSWIMVTIRLTDAQYRERIGPDAVQYLIFQRYLIVAALLICCASLLIILPVNLLGTNLENAYPLAYTTISNLSNNSVLLWIPSIMCVVYILLILGMMKHFTENLPFKSQFKTNAVMITNINIHKSNHSLVTSENVQAYLNQLYPDISAEVTLAYNVEKLAKYLKKLEYLSMALEYCEKYNLKSEGTVRLKMVPKTFGVLASCLCLPEFFCKRVDAQEFYQRKVEKLQQKVDKERKNIRNKPLGIAFVVLPSFCTAKKLVDDFKLSANRNVKKLSIQQDLGAEFWNVKLSPPKKDIIWENLRNIGPRSFLRGCLVNFLYVILFIFVSSPAVLLAWFQTFDRSTAGIQDKAIEKSSLLGFMIPPLTFVSVAVFMPYLIFLLDDMRSHWKMSTLNLRVMTKTYIYLLSMVVILPSVGLTSVYKFIDSVFLKNERVQWNCIFLIDNGAFFTNYVITASLGGLCMELMRVCDLILYVFTLIMMKCKAERKALIKNTLIEFPYGFMYAYQLTVMTTVIAYSILCPLITPFGVIYMLVRHFVDRYNIYFSYAPSRISPNCHYRAVNFVILSSLVMLSTILAFSWLRFGKNNGNTIFLIVCACIFVAFLITKHVVQIIRSFQSSSSNGTAHQDSVSARNNGNAASGVENNSTSGADALNHETSPLNDENFGAIIRFDCPYLTFKPTWLSRQPTPNYRPTKHATIVEVDTNKEDAKASNCGKSRTYSFSFDFASSTNHNSDLQSCRQDSQEHNNVCTGTNEAVTCNSPGEVLVENEPTAEKAAASESFC